LPATERGCGKLLPAIRISLSPLLSSHRQAQINQKAILNFHLRVGGSVNYANEFQYTDHPFSFLLAVPASTK
jgi:hypothetical protein